MCTHTTHTYKYEYVHTVYCMYVCICIRILIYMYVHTHMCIHVFLHIYTRVHIHICTYKRLLCQLFRAVLNTRLGWYRYVRCALCNRTACTVVQLLQYKLRVHRPTVQLHCTLSWLANSHWVFCSCDLHRVAGQKCTKFTGRAVYRKSSPNLTPFAVTNF